MVLLLPSSVPLTLLANPASGSGLRTISLIQSPEIFKISVSISSLSLLGSSCSCLLSSPILFSLNTASLVILRIVSLLSLCKLGDSTFIALSTISSSGFTLRFSRTGLPLELPFPPEFALGKSLKGTTWICSSDAGDGFSIVVFSTLGRQWWDWMISIPPAPIHSVSLLAA